MKIPGLTQAIIEAHADDSSIARGKAYYESGAVKTLKRTSETEVEAYVQGSDIAPYHVEIRHDSNGVVSAVCTCPYVSGSWCRHIVAALIAVLNTDGEPGRRVEWMLQDLSRRDLVELLKRLVDGYPEVRPLIEQECRRLNAE